MPTQTKKEKEFLSRAEKALEMYEQYQSRLAEVIPTLSDPTYTDIAFTRYGETYLRRQAIEYLVRMREKAVNETDTKVKILLIKEAYAYIMSGNNGSGSNGSSDMRKYYSVFQKKKPQTISAVSERIKILETNDSDYVVDSVFSGILNIFINVREMVCPLKNKTKDK